PTNFARRLDNVSKRHSQFDPDGDTAREDWNNRRQKQRETHLEFLPRWRAAACTDLSARSVEQALACPPEGQAEACSTMSGLARSFVRLFVSAAFSALPG